MIFPIYNATHFSWNGNCGTAEASSIGFEGGAENQKIVLENPARGTKKVFRMTQVIRNPDGDIAMWIYESLLNTASLKIFND